MPQDIIRSTIRFRNNVMNSPFFKGGFTNSFTGAVGLKYYLEHVYSLSWDSGYIPYNSGGLLNNPTISNQYRRTDGGDFLKDGFSDGDDIVFYTVLRIGYTPTVGSYATVDIPYYVVNKILSVTSDTIVFGTIINYQAAVNSVASQPFISSAALERTYDATIVGLTKINGADLNYGFVDNADQYSNLSIIDNTSVGFYTNALKDTGIATTLGALNPSIKSNKVDSDNVVIKRESRSPKQFTINGSSISLDAIQNFIVFQTFELPSYKESWLNNIINGTQPEEFANEASLKYTNQISFYNNYADSNTKKTKIFESQKGNIGWANETFNGGLNNYEITNVSYTDLQGGSIEKLDVGGCSVSITIRSNNAKFSTADAYKRVFYLTHTSLKNSSEYENNGNFYNANLLRDGAYVSYDDTNIGSSLIKNLVCTPNGSYEVTITADIDFSTYNNLYPSKIPNEGDYYRLAVVCATNKIILGSTDATTSVGVPSASDELVNLDVDINTYLKNTDIPNLWLHDRFEIFDHPTNVDGEGYTEYKGWIEDGVVLYADKRLKEGAFINNIRISAVAERQSDKSTFEIDGYDLDLSDQIVSNGVQQFNINQSVGYNLNENDQFNRLIVTTGATVNGYVSYNILIPYKLPWQAWQRLEDADTVFFVNDPQSEFGLNKKSSNYSGLQDYEVKLYLTADILQDGIVTEYIDRSPPLEIKNYDDPTDFTNEVITLTEDLVSTSGAIKTDSTTIIKAVFTKVGHGLNVNDLCGVIRLEPQRALGNGIHEISTLREGYATSPLIPITGSYASIEVDTDTITLSCKTNINYIDDEPYRISARLYPLLSAPATGDYNNDYNNDYDNL